MYWKKRDCVCSTKKECSDSEGRPRHFQGSDEEYGIPTAAYETFDTPEAAPTNLKQHFGTDRFKG